MKRVRLLVPFLDCPRWATPELPDGQADALVAGGRAEWFGGAVRVDPAGEPPDEIDRLDTDAGSPADEFTPDANKPRAHDRRRRNA